MKYCWRDVNKIEGRKRVTLSLVLLRERPLATITERTTDTSLELGVFGMRYVK